MGISLAITQAFCHAFRYVFPSYLSFLTTKFIIWSRAIARMCDLCRYPTSTNQIKATGLQSEGGIISIVSNTYHIIPTRPWT